MTLPHWLYVLSGVGTFFVGFCIGLGWAPQSTVHCPSCGAKLLVDHGAEI